MRADVPRARLRAGRRRDRLGLDAGRAPAVRSRGVARQPRGARRERDGDRPGDAPADASARRGHDQAVRHLARCGSSSDRLGLGADLGAARSRAFGPVLYNLYGSTEVAYATIATPEDLRAEPSTVGKVVRGSVVKILDDDGKELRRRRERPDLRRQHLQFEGYTGGGSKEIDRGPDVARATSATSTSAGRLFIDGRDDEMIVSGGENVFPAEVEELLASHEQIDEAAVIGVDDEEFGQRLKAFVVLRGASLERGRDQGLRQGQPRPLQGPARGRVRRRAAPQPDRQGPQARAGRSRPQARRADWAAETDGNSTDPSAPTAAARIRKCRIDRRSPMPPAFRSQFPVLERLSYLNAGTEAASPARRRGGPCRIDRSSTRGPLRARVLRELTRLAARLRAGYAGVLGCDESEVALTGSTTDGVNTVIAGLDLRAGDEIVTTDEEHPGLLAPLGRARRRHGVKVRVVPFAELAGAVSPSTRLVACSHVSWVGGASPTCGAAATGVPVLLDAAQALGAVPVDVRALGCDFYAGSGQKWLCGPGGERLPVRAARPPRPAARAVARLRVARRSRPGARVRAGRRASSARPRLSGGHAQRRRAASLEVLDEAGWDWVHERGRDAGRVARRPARRARAVGGAARAFDARLVEGRGPAGRGRAAGRRGRHRPQHPRVRARPGIGRGVVVGVRARGSGNAGSETRLTVIR